MSPRVQKHKCNVHRQIEKLAPIPGGESYRSPVIVGSVRDMLGIDR